MLIYANSCTLYRKELVALVDFASKVDVNNFCYIWFEPRSGYAFASDCKRAARVLATNGKGVGAPFYIHRDFGARILRDKYESVTFVAEWSADDFALCVRAQCELPDKDDSTFSYRSSADPIAPNIHKLFDLGLPSKPTVPRFSVDIEALRSLELVQAAALSGLPKSARDNPSNFGTFFVPKEMRGPLGYVCGAWQAIIAPAVETDIGEWEKRLASWRGNATKVEKARKRIVKSASEIVNERHAGAFEALAPNDGGRARGGAR